MDMEEQKKVIKEQNISVRGEITCLKSQHLEDNSSLSALPTQ